MTGTILVDIDGIITEMEYIGKKRRKVNRSKREDIIKHEKLEKPCPDRHESR